MKEAVGSSAVDPQAVDATIRPADAVAASFLMRSSPQFLRPYLELVRVDRPIGFWLLLLPCWWSAALAAVAAGQTLPNIAHLLLFVVGTIAMRGAGSTWNDIVDRKLDAQVARTRGRPLPSGRIGVRAAILLAIALGLVGLAVLLQFNLFAIQLGLLSLVPVAVYPFMKRFTSYPQVVLGLAFAWGALMGWAAVFGALALPPLLLYAATIAWTVGYDTIYALQDIEDDEIVGIRSTARAHAEDVPRFVATCYLVAIALVCVAIFLVRPGIFAFLGAAGFALHLMGQVRAIRPGEPAVALRLFRSNREAGLILFAGLAAEAAFWGLMFPP